MSIRGVALLAIGCAGLMAGPVLAASRAPVRVKAAQAAPAWEESDFIVVSGPESPRVAYALRRTAEGLRLAVEAGRLGNGGTAVQVGAAAARTITLTGKEGRVIHLPQSGVDRYEFTIPTAVLVDQASDWARLRLGLAVAWKGGPYGEDRQRERFLQRDDAAAHDGLSPDPAAWQPLNLEDYTVLVADRKNRILVPFTQPMDGKASIVIEDSSGRRVRNLVSGQAMTRGSHQAPWDGVDEEGKVAPPGTYRWRAAFHPGITPHYLFSFGNAPGSNHSTFQAATRNRDWIFFASPVTEGGWNMIALDSTGKMQQGYNWGWGVGLDKCAIAADEKYVYVAHDGFSNAQSNAVDRNKPDWKGVYNLQLERFDIRSGAGADFPTIGRLASVQTTEVGPGSPEKKPDRVGLEGMALLNGKLYISDFHTGSILIMNPATGARDGEIKLENPGPLAPAGDALLAVSGSSIVRIDPGSGAVRTLVAPGKMVPAGLAVDAAGDIYASDSRDQNVKVLNPAGGALREIGKPGGEYAGPYDPLRMIHPAGLVVAPDGRLWVTESGRWTPKRLAAYDAQTGQMSHEQFGPTHYGASGGGFDSANPSRWIGLSTLWKVDLARESAAPQAVLGPYEAIHFHFVHQDGRTFLVALGGATTLYELRPDGAAKPLAIVGSVHRYAFDKGWAPPLAFIQAVNRAYPNLHYTSGQIAQKGPGFLWVDRNGDGQIQEDEFDFSTASSNFAGAYWGDDFHDLTLKVPATVNGRTVMVTLQPTGYYPGGAPRYPGLNAACLAGKPIDIPGGGNEVETATDRFGDMICNTDPLTAFSPAGKQLWTYPNHWAGVGGSHDAPLPETGQLQGALFFQGVAPLDKSSDVFVMNGNHGRFFVLTSDGLYLDEMFKDVRLGGSNDEYMIGGENFGGIFDKGADGHYYLQAGGNEYRIFRIDGLNQVQRASGTLVVSPAQAAAAERGLVRRAAAVSTPRSAVIPYLPTAPTIDGRDNDWPGEAGVHWDKNGQFPVTVRVGYDSGHLYLYYLVRDDSPWINNGKDWRSLFKTGDSVDLQLGTDSGADPHRTGPAPGDLRLLIAPYQGKTIAVLYRHRLPRPDQPVVFQSPWRSEKVDSVKVLQDAAIAVSRENGQYRVEAAIPLSDLGLAHPEGKSFKADFGVIYGDNAGTVDLLRSYWSSQNTGLVNDVPGEIMLTPGLWGTVQFAGTAPPEK